MPLSYAVEEVDSGGSGDWNWPSAGTVGGSVQVGGEIGAVSNANVSVQLTGVIVILLVVAVVALTMKWPGGGA